MDLVLPPNAPCYAPLKQVQSADIIVTRAAGGSPKYHSNCFAINAAVGPEALTNTITSRGPLASDISTDEAIRVVVIAFADDRCQTPQICFISSPIANAQSQQVLLNAHCAPQWAGCLPPR